MDEQVSSISKVLNRIREAAEEALRQRHPNPAAPRHGRENLSQTIWLTVEQAVRYLGFPTRQALYQAVRRGHVPVHRLGRALRFLKAELDQHLTRAR